MEYCSYEEGFDKYDARSGCSDYGGSDDLTDDFDRQELEWALYSQIHHEEADDSKTHSKSWLEQECDVSVTEDGETSKNTREHASSTPKTAQRITDNSLLSSGKTSKKKKRKTLDEDSKKTSKEIKKKVKENKRKSSNKDTIINLEALLVPEPSKVTLVNKKHGKTEGAELRKKQKPGDKSKKSKDVHKKGEVTQEFILVSSNNSETSSDTECQTQNAVTENGDCARINSDSDYSFGDMHAEEKTDIQLNVNDPKEWCDDDTIFDNKDVKLEDVHNSLGDCDWDLINADVWKAGSITGRVRSRYYRSSVKCNNCNERGHLMKDCPEPKKLPACILCGLRGHISRACPESLCFNCNRPGHGSRNCAEPRRSRTVECRRCFARGHIATECPDIWRQFHITTEPGPMCKGSQKENKSRFCFNCTKKGHCAYECRDSMMDSWKLPVTPFVAHYEMKAAFVTAKHSKKRQFDSSHEIPAKHMKPSHTPTKKTPQATSEQSWEPTSYAKDVLAKSSGKTKLSRVKRLAESHYSDDFPRTPLEEYIEISKDTPRKRLTSKQENKRKWKAWQKKRKSDNQEQRLSQLQQFIGYEDEQEAPSGGRHWRDSESRHDSGGSRKSRWDSAAGEGSHPGGGGKRNRSRKGGKGGDRKHSDGHKCDSHNDVWDPVDYHDPWDTAGDGDRHNSEGFRRDSGRKHIHVTKRGFRMFRQ